MSVVAYVFKFIKLKEFLPYFIIGGTSTAIDWTIFAIATSKFHFHYETALVLGYTGAGVFHYSSNKLITFKCRSKKVLAQYFLYLIVTVVSLVISMGIIAILVKGAMLNKMYARILTTLFMLVPNYLLHKYFTFNKKIFIEII